MIGLYESPPCQPLEATTDFKTVRKALRPRVGDLFISTKKIKGQTFHTKVELVDTTGVFISVRGFAENGNVMSSLVTLLPIRTYKKYVIRSFRIGAHFSPSNK